METKFVIYGHRGASEYKPENTFSSFYLALEQGSDGLETDIQVTKDNQLILFHDDDLKRTTGADGAVQDYTLKELKQLLVYNKDHSYTDRMITFEEFLLHFGYRDLTFAIEIKKPHIERQVLERLASCNMKAKCIITSFDYMNLARTYELDRHIRLGYLVKDWDEEVKEKLDQIKAYQVCLKAENITKDIVKQVHEAGYSLRAWGVSNDTLMKDVIDVGVDGGMTVNFPDVLVKYICETTATNCA